MEMLANAIAVIIFQCKYMNHIKVRYALNLHSVICQLYLSKAEKKKVLKSGNDTDISVKNDSHTS